MNRTTEVLLGIRRIIKFYESLIKEVAEAYGLTQIEADIIGFLANNPGKDTAKDIVELRMLQKSNVSLAVESLIQKGLLTRRTSLEDRRKIHLSLTEQADDITAAIRKVRETFQERLFQGFAQEEYQLYISLVERIIQNTENKN